LGRRKEMKGGKAGIENQKRYLSETNTTTGAQGGGFVSRGLIAWIGGGIYKKLRKRRA